MSNSIMIIGAGPGIGQAVARRFGREGWQIVLTGRNPERLTALTAELQADGITAHAVAADATDPAALRAAVAKADALTGRLTAVHFNTGVVRKQDLFSMTPRSPAILRSMSLQGCTRSGRPPSCSARAAAPSS